MNRQKEYINLLDEMQELNKKLKVIRKTKKEIEAELTRYMNQNNLKSFRLNDKYKLSINKLVLDDTEEEKIKNIKLKAEEKEQNRQVKILKESVFKEI